MANNSIATYKTHKQVLDFQDMLSPDPKRDKIAVVLLNYGDQGATDTVTHFLDRDDARLLLTLVAQDALPPERPAQVGHERNGGGPQVQEARERWTDFKGSKRSDGSPPESRVFSIECLDETRYRNPWAIRLKRGPGQVIGAGAIKPRGKPEVEIHIMVPAWDMRRLALRVLDYIRAWEILNGPQRENNTPPPISGEGPGVGAGQVVTEHAAGGSGTVANTVGADPRVRPATYANGDQVDETNAAEVSAFDAYAKAHGGKAPASRSSLRNWRKHNGK